MIEVEKLDEVERSLLERKGRKGRKRVSLLATTCRSKLGRRWPAHDQSKAPKKERTAEIKVDGIS